MADDGPQAVVRQLVMGFRGTHLLYVMAELGVADCLVSGPRDAGDLAAELGADPDALHRVLRALAQLGVLEQGTDGRFALTPAGDCLRTDHPGSLRPAARLWGHEMFQRAWGDLLHTVRTGETAFDHVFGMPAFAYLDVNPEASAVYNQFMATRQAATPAVAAAYDFAPFGTIVDVGGGNGSLLAEILGVFPGPRGVILDLPHARTDADETIRATGLTGRVRFEAQDFFERVTPGADCYVLRQVIHDWDDARADAILRSCRQAIPPHGRLLLIEILLPAAGDPDLEAVMVDVTMLARVGGRERTEAEYRDLLDRAGFRLERVISTTVQRAIIECVPV